MSNTQVISEFRNGVYKEYIVNPQHLINVKNGLLDLSTRPMTLRPHTPEVFSTIQLDVNYRPEAVCPVFDRFLSDVCAYPAPNTGRSTGRSTSDDDDRAGIDEATTEARKQFILEFMGAIFSNVHADRFNKQTLFLYGPADTGKTLLLNLVESITGSYVMIDCLKAAKTAKHPKWAKMAKKSQLNDTRLAVSADTAFIDKRTMKAANDFSGFCWFNMHLKPDLGSLTRSGFLTEAERRKIAVFQFPNVIPVDKRDCWLLEKMLAERDGIFAKVISVFSAMKGFDFHEPYGSEIKPATASTVC